MITLNIKLKTIRLECLDLANNALFVIRALRSPTLNRNASLEILYYELCDEFDLEFRNG